MATFLTSDLHFGHANICEYTGRPYTSVDEMNEDLVERWNSVVGEFDDVVILGDLALGRLDDSLGYVQLLNGRKYLVPGNHDRMFGCQGTKYANAVQRYVDAGINDVMEEHAHVYLNGKCVLACHFPYTGDSQHEAEDRFFEHRPMDKGEFLLHGHVHGLWRKNGRMIDVGVDSWGGYPVSSDELELLFRLAPTNIESKRWEPSA